jgi:hypothetical protein
VFGFGSFIEGVEAEKMREESGLDKIVIKLLCLNLQIYELSSTSHDSNLFSEAA